MGKFWVPPQQDKDIIDCHKGNSKNDME